MSTKLVPVVIFALFLTNLALVKTYDGFPSREEISKWVELFQNSLLLDLDKYTGIKKLEKTYDDLRRAKLHKIDGRSLVHKMSSDLTTYLEKKMKALERLAEAAEKTIETYKFDSKINFTEQKFYNMKDFKDDDSRLVYSEKFNKPVNFSYSGVHIPVEIYEESIEIQNGLNWTSSLDEVFRENAEEDAAIMQQYFGSHSGFMRTYPASKWIVLPQKPNFPDLYDVRLQPWYVHASSSPKDMLILMDASGSMHGQTMEIMKIAVKTLLTTLEENDFVNIISFNSTAKWISCFDTLVQANRRNKQILSKRIDSIVDGKMANLSVGLNFAFKAFEKFREMRAERWAGSECNQVIMLFSDGGTEEAWEVLDKYNANKTVRVFAYAIGPNPVPYATLKEIACSNRGYFTEIQAMGAVRTKIQDYVKVLGRPLVLSTTRSFEWTNFYLDAMGLGMMTTVTLPVFNRTDMGNQSLVGVMGIDVALREMLDFEPSYEIGPAGYTFSINQNGYVAFHPNLKTEFEFIPDPPHLDLLDVEIGSLAKEELRDAMINLHSSNRSFTSLLKMPQGRFIVEHRMKYYFTPLNKTTFSIAIVIPADRTHFLHIEKVEIPPGFDVNKNEMEGMYLAPWKYCHGKVLKRGIAELLKNLSHTARRNPDSCKMELLHRLLWDIRKTDDIMHYWQSEEQDDHRDGVVATYVQSESGLTRIYPPNEARYVVTHTDPSKSLIYQRAFYGEDYVFLLPEIRFNSSSNQSEPIELVVNIVKSISFARSGVTYKPAVVGVVMDPVWLYSYLLDNCPDVDYIVCYLIDDGGFIVSANQPDHLLLLGVFLGEVDSEIMTELYKKKVYVRTHNLCNGMFDKMQRLGVLMANDHDVQNEDFNYEDRCEKLPVKDNAGFRAPSLPFYFTISSLKIGWLFDFEAWSYLKYWMLSLFSLLKLPMSEALPEFYELANETTCTTHEAQYFWGKFNRSYSGIVACSNCTRHYSLKKVGQMNILLLVTEKPCAPVFCKSVPPLLQAKTEVLKTENNPCDRPLRYRRRPEKCFYFSHDENSSECGSVGSLPLPHFALFVELLCLLAITKMIYTDDNIPLSDLTL